MRKFYVLMIAMACGLSLQARTLYLNTGGSALWETDGANKFAVWHWQGSGEGQWTGWMTHVDGDVWSVDVSDASNMVIFCRFNTAATSPSWGADMWNQTDDLEPGSNNLFTITGWGSDKSQGTWSTYNPGDTPGPGPGPDPQPGGAKDYYIRGFFNNTDASIPTAEELFENGLLPLTFTGDDKSLGYFYIMVCDEGATVGRDYMSEGYAEGGTHVTLRDKETLSTPNKWGIPAGSVTFYLYDNGDGSLELSTEPIPGKTLVGGGGEEAVENTTVTEKARKMMIDGQLRIIRGEKMFDATGRQL